MDLFVGDEDGRGGYAGVAGRRAIFAFQRQEVNVDHAAELGW